LTRLSPGPAPERSALDRLVGRDPITEQASDVVRGGVWRFFRQGEFAGWYVNLETPARRHADGVDTTDLVLDVVVAPDRTWVWKDEDEMAERIGWPHYFDQDGADRIRAEGER
jgi:hypothetical protein